MKTWSEIISADYTMIFYREWMTKLLHYIYVHKSCALNFTKSLLSPSQRSFFIPYPGGGVVGTMSLWPGWATPLLPNDWCQCQYVWLCKCLYTRFLLLCCTVVLSCTVLWLKKCASLVSASAGSLAAQAYVLKLSHWVAKWLGGSVGWSMVSHLLDHGFNSLP